MSLLRTPLFFVVALLAASVVHAGPFKVSGPAEVTFHGKAVGLKLVGTTQELACTDEGTRLVFDVKLDTLKTGIELRDRHMTEKYLETAKFPKATLTLDKATLVLPASGTQKGKTTGVLKLHGKSKEVPVSFEIKGNQGSYAVKATMKVNYKDFGIEVPTYMGVTVKPDLDVEVAFTAKDA